MPTHRVPPDILQRNIIVDIDERNVVNVVVADMSAYGLTDSSANLSYVVDQEAAEQYLAVELEGSSDKFVGVIAESNKAIFKQVIDATQASLKLVRERGINSAVIPLSSLLANALRIDEKFLIMGALLGIREFTDQMRDGGHDPIISEIVVAAGTSIFQTWIRDDISLYQLFGERETDEEEGVFIPLVQPAGTAGSPNDVQHHWLELIGNFLADHEESHMTVIFEAETGEPVQVLERKSPFELGGIDEGMAAVDVEHVRVDGRRLLIVGKNFTVNLPGAQRIDPEIVENIHGIEKYIPITPSSIPVIVESEGKGSTPGTKLHVDTAVFDKDTTIFKTDKGIDNFNAEFAQQLVPEMMGRMGAPTVKSAIPPQGEIALTSWLSEQTLEMSRDDIIYHVTRRIYGGVEFEMALDERGRFIGAKAWGNRRNYPDGAPLTIGKFNDAATYVRNISFRTHRTEDGANLHVPISFDPDGGADYATLTFIRWYDSEPLRKAREGMKTDDTLSGIIFRGPGALARAGAFVRHLDKKSLHMKATLERHQQIMESASSSTNKEFLTLLALLRRYAAQGQELNAQEELEVAYVEMLMRQALGPKIVDKIVKKAKIPPPRKRGKGGANPPPPPPESGGAAPAGGDAGGPLAKPADIGGAMRADASAAAGDGIEAEGPTTHIEVEASLPLRAIWQSAAVLTASMPSATPQL